MIQNYPQNINLGNKASRVIYPVIYKDLKFILSKDNIMVFGGNPKKVTILGHGTSAAFVQFLMAYANSLEESSYGE